MDDTLMQMMRLASKGYACSQIMVLLALAKCQKTNPGWVRAMAGLAYGGGSGRATCGILTGACCVIGYFAGKGDDDTPENRALPLMLEAINDWFDENVGARHEGITCQAIVGAAGPQASRSICGTILAQTYGQTLKILAEHGIEV